MKLRIRGNSLRLRLERHEVDIFAREGRVEGHLALSPGARLVYGLEAAEVEAVSLAGDGVRVLVPRDLAHRWASGDDVGFDAEVQVGDERVTVLVEKDFRCLHKRPGEDESGQYPHPAE